MSGSSTRRTITALSLVLLPLPACDSGSAGESTVLPHSRAEQPSPARTTPTPADLGTFVRDRARDLAATEYSPPAATLPPDLAALDYEAYRSIRFREEASLWRGKAPFEVQLFHPGFLYDEPVRIHVVEGDSVSELPFDRSRFTYEGPAGALSETAASAGVGYSGFRVHFPLNEPGRMDEVAVFQGASYFRLVGPGHVYGLSSRGLAVNVATDGEEEFPDFREFWLTRPGAGDDRLVIHALLDSPSLTGAYRFLLRPDDVTEVDVEAHLFARTDVQKLGVAPLSSMFLFDPGLAHAFDDFRSRVHDSDGLMMLTRRGEWIWRPLGNLRGLRVTSLMDEDPRGFGLTQRARAFEQYLDLEAQYHRRPSEWVQMAEGDWGRGRVELLEIPTESEFNDNIAAYWVPDEPFLAGQEKRFSYMLRTFDSRLQEQTLAQVRTSRDGWDALPGEAAPPPRSQRRFVVDFEEAPSGLDPGAPVEASLETSAGEVWDVAVTPLPDEGEWRVTFRLRPDGDRPADMRLFLHQAGRPVSETWSYVWYPEQVR